MVKFEEGRVWHYFSFLVLVLAYFSLDHLHLVLITFFLHRPGSIWCQRKFEILFTFWVPLVMRWNPAWNMRAECLSTCFMYDVFSLKLVLVLVDPIIEVVLTPVCFGSLEPLCDLVTWNLVVVLPVFDPELVPNQAIQLACNISMLVL